MRSDACPEAMARLVLDRLAVLRLGTGVFEEATRLLSFASIASGVDTDPEVGSVSPR